MEVIEPARMNQPKEAPGTHPGQARGHSWSHSSQDVLINELVNTTFLQMSVITVTLYGTSDMTQIS